MNDSKMQEIFLEKVILNIGVGTSENLFQNAKALLKKLTDRDASPTMSRKRDPSLKLKKGQVIGAYVTLRGKQAEDMLKKTLDANENRLKPTSVGPNTINFGIREYIDITGVKYDPKIGMLGMNVNASFARRGKRVERRKRLRSTIARKHNMIKEEEILEFVKKKFDAKLIEE